MMQEGTQKRQKNKVDVGVCVSPEAQRVSHVPRWAAVSLLLLIFFNTIAAPVENMLLYTAYTPARRYHTFVQVVHENFKVIKYAVVHRVQPS